MDERRMRTAMLCVHSSKMFAWRVIGFLYCQLELPLRQKVALEANRAAQIVPPTAH